MGENAELRHGLTRQALMRLVNDEIQDINRSFEPVAEDYVVLCECGRRGCLDQIRIRAGAFERLHGRFGVFVVAAGHEQPELERVERSEPGYNVVVLHPHAQELARRLSLLETDD